jgi:hypothetical protein
MAQDHWPLSQHIVDVFVAVYIVDHGPFGTLEKERVRRAQESHVAADATCEGILGQLI